MLLRGEIMKVLRGLLNPFVILLFLFTFISPSLAQDDLSAVIAKIQPSVVLILTYDADGKIHSQATGFFVSDNGEVITSRHVLLGISRADIKTQSGNIYPITNVVAEDKEGDIIRVSTDIPSGEAHPLAICPTVPKVGERVVVLGNPLGLEQTAADGIVSAVRDIPGFGNIIQITAPISPGSSGSPVVNINGEVIAVATFQFVEGQNLNFAIPAERVAKLTTGNEQTISEWNTGVGEEWLLSAEGLHSIGSYWVGYGDYDKALSYFEDAIKKKPDYPEAYLCIAYCDGQLGRYDEAIEACKQAIRIKPDYAFAHCCLGSVYEDLGRYDDAIEAYKQAIQIDPDDLYSHCCLGNVYAELGRYNDAIEAYKQAIRIDPADASAHFFLGSVYDELGRYNDAIEAFKQAIRINPAGALEHYSLGITYFLLGDTGSALDEYKILKELDKGLANELFNMIYP